MPIHLSVSPHGTARLPQDGFSRNLIFAYFSKICRENSSFNETWQNNGYFTWRPIDFLIISRWILLRMRNVSDRVLDKIETHILCSITFFEDRVFYGIMWVSLVEPDRPQMTTRHVRITCWIPKSTHTHSSCVILIDFHGNNFYTNAP